MCTSCHTGRYYRTYGAAGGYAHHCTEHSNYRADNCGNPNDGADNGGYAHHGTHDSTHSGTHANTSADCHRFN